MSIVVCIDGTHYVSLNASKKIVYMRHRRFLSKGHRFHQKNMDKFFDNNDERNSDAPLGNSKGQRVFKIVSNIIFVFRKKIKDGKPRKDVKSGLSFADPKVEEAMKNIFKVTAK